MITATYLEDRASCKGDSAGISGQTIILGRTCVTQPDTPAFADLVKVSRRQVEVKADGDSVQIIGVRLC